jgi:hypothetical protein
MFKDTPLGILAMLENPSLSRESRLTKLLRDPNADGTPEWFMNVPAYFNDALDIKQTPRVTADLNQVSKIAASSQLVWTQGSNFAFKTGDFIYDVTTKNERWSQTLNSVRYAIQILDAQDAKAGFTGRVVFDVLKPDSQRSRLARKFSRTMTQIEFVRMLLTGEGVRE